MQSGLANMQNLKATVRDPAGLHRLREETNKLGMDSIEIDLISVEDTINSGSELNLELQQMHSK